MQIAFILLIYILLIYFLSKIWLKNLNDRYINNKKFIMKIKNLKLFDFYLKNLKKLQIFYIVILYKFYDFKKTLAIYFYSN